MRGSDVVIVGLFAAGEKDYAEQMDQAAEAVVALGARVVARFVQRLGASDGAVRRTAEPYSSRTLLSEGKLREIAAACEASGAGAVVFLNALTARQRGALSETLGRPALGLAELAPGGRP